MTDEACPRCGFRGWYEIEDGEIFCEEPGCPHAVKSRAAADRHAEDTRRFLAQRESEERRRQEAFDEYEERIRASRVSGSRRVISHAK